MNYRDIYFLRDKALINSRRLPQALKVHLWVVEADIAPLPSDRPLWVGDGKLSLP